MSESASIPTPKSRFLGALIRLGHDIGEALDHAGAEIVADSNLHWEKRERPADVRKVNIT